MLTREQTEQILKGKSKWVNIVFNDSENPTLVKHFVFAFETTNLNDLLNFELSLLDDQAKLIKFAATEQKIPALTFTIQVIKLKMLQKQPMVQYLEITNC